MTGIFKIFNPFVPNAPFLYHLTTENPKSALGTNGLRCSILRKLLTTFKDQSQGHR